MALEVYPIYRKYTNNKNFFKIINQNEFIELSIIGKTIISKKNKASIYPDKLFISDLIVGSKFIVEILPEEFLEVENNANLMC